MMTKRQRSGADKRIAGYAIDAAPMHLPLAQAVKNSGTGAPAIA